MSEPLERIEAALQEARQMSQLFGNPSKTEWFRDALAAVEELRRDRQFDAAHAAFIQDNPSFAVEKPHTCECPTRKALSNVVVTLRHIPTMQGREYVQLGIMANNALAAPCPCCIERDLLRAQVEVLEAGNVKAAVLDKFADMTVARNEDMETIRELRAQVAELAEALRYMVTRFDGVDNGYCKMCQARRKYTAGGKKTSKCKNSTCPSHRNTAALAKVEVPRAE